MVIEVDGIAQGFAHRYWKKIANFKNKQKIKHQEQLKKLGKYLKSIRSRKICVEVWKGIPAKKDAIGTFSRAW